ncbi:hypothetical protein KI387_008526 [Taxus chinensis]|uniref:Receptor-like serine/threonine-protein kinase n=1 Tax=Taxus chinensis TaxID=29808 RepID=A0AA38FJA8_TAXCH|nr:hypothetical protein KI387_008526 [Taxus chinensis]
MAVGETLTGTQTKVSPNGVFKLGFFQLDGTQKWYAGFWYAKVPEQTVAWVFNAANPLQNNSAILNLTENGNLVLSSGRSVIWSTNVTAQPASSATLTNKGNLVVYAAKNNSEIIWQSFDHPGNTWLPGMKIASGQRLTAWKSPWDPTPGLYNLQLDEANDQFILVGRNSVKYWESGNWNGQIFSKVPEMTQGFMYVFSYFNSTTYKYFTYNVKPTSTSVSRFVMSESGDIKVYSLLSNTNKWTMFWAQPRDQCQVYAVCGSYGTCKNVNVQFCTCLDGFAPKDNRAWSSQEWSSGCVRNTPLDSCGNSSTDGFSELTGESLPAGGVSTASVSTDECRASCLKNCSCTAYSYGSNLCKLWFGDLFNLGDTLPASDPLFVRLAAVDVPTAGSNKKGTVTGVVAGSIGGVAALLAIGLVIFLCVRRRRSMLKSSEYPGSLTVYSYRELQIATKNFSERLGGGGFGSVFKGTLADKTLAAVKKLEGVSQGEKQFRMEVSTIGTIQHVNLIRLKGFCSEGSSRLLVYEYLHNGSLDKLLFSKAEGAPVLDWNTRFGIALGTARGILYLHEKCRDCIIHCDIKPENILIDSEFCPKVADFGLAKLMGREFSHVLTTMRGTRGYLAPEWISGLAITPKADVYSFGMTLLEIIAGRRNMEANAAEASQLFFPTWAATQISQENTMALLDKKLNNDADAEQLKRAAIVGGWCIQDDEDARPSMSQVVQVLQGIGDLPVPPIPRSLQALVAKANSLVFYWDKETAPRSNTSSSRGSKSATANNSSRTSENFSNSVTSRESSHNGSDTAT